MSASSMIPCAISLISRSRCMMAASLEVSCFWEVCWRVAWEKDLSASDSMMEGSM